MVWRVEEIHGREMEITGTPQLRTFWDITETREEMLALERLFSKTPDVLTTGIRPPLIRSSVKVKEAGHDRWEAEMIYGVNPAPEAGQVIVSGSTSNGRATVTRALDCFDAVSITGTYPTQSLAIGVDSDGNTQGVEIDVPSPGFSIEVWIELAAFTYSYRRRVETVSGLVYNSKKFFGYEAGEVKFKRLDYSGQKELNATAKKELMRLKFDFEVSANQLYDAANPTKFPGVEIPGMTRPLSKRGWDYLDVRTATFVVESETPDPEPPGFVPTKWKVRLPVMARAMQILTPLDFATFGIGTG